MTLTQDDERALCLKLLTSPHLSIPERQALPEQTARFRVILAALESSLKAAGYFPRPYSPGDQIGVGAAIEIRGDEICFHEQHECGVGRYGPVQSRRVKSIDTATRNFIAIHGGSQIDGVKIDMDH